MQFFDDDQNFWLMSTKYQIWIYSLHFFCYERSSISITLWGLETEPQSKLIFIDGHFILVTRWEDQREKTLMIIMIMGIFSMSENIILSLKFYLVFFHFSWKFLWKVEVYLCQGERLKMSFGSFESLKTSNHPFEIKIQFSKTIFLSRWKV